MKSSNHSLFEQKNNTSELSKEAVFNWLKENQDYTDEFFSKYIVNNEMKLIKKRFSQISNVFSERQCDNSRHSISSSSSFSKFPMTRLHSVDFDCIGLKPVLSIGIDGQRSFISDEKVGKTAPIYREQPTNIKLTERELINELTLDICNDLDISSLCYKILQNVCILLDADKSSLYLVEKDEKTGQKYLFSKLFDVSRESGSLEEHQEKINGKVIFIPFGKGISGNVAEKGEFINLTNAYEDPRFTDEVDKMTGYRTYSILSMPIKSPENGEVVGVAQVVNKRSSKKIIDIISEDNIPQNMAFHPFDERDIEILGSYVAFCSIGLHNAEIYQLSKLETKRSQVLLELARLLFVDQSNINHVIDTVLSHALQLMDCRICQLFLIKDSVNENFSNFPLSDHEEFNAENIEEYFSEIYEMSIEDLETLNNYQISELDKLKHPLDFELCRQILTTGESVNSDTNGKYESESILCSPIKNSNGHLVGICILIDKCTRENFKKRMEEDKIIELLNNSSVIINNDESESILKNPSFFFESKIKQTKRFNQNDESIFEAFAIFAGLAIANTQLFEKMIRAEAKQKIAIDVLQYHAMAPTEQAEDLAKSIIPTSKFFNLDSFQFSDFNLSDNDTLAASLRIFIDFDFLDEFKVPVPIFCRWLLSVKKNYRHVTYHNWRHALNVLQTMFAIFRTGGLEDIFTHLEIFSILIACISHDLDHRGTNNQYQIKTMSPLAQLYSTSVLEHHHFNQCMLILNSKGSDILAEMSKESRSEVIKIIEYCILATDLSLHFSHLPQFVQLVNERKSNSKIWSDMEAKVLLTKILMTGCDVSAIMKPWSVQKKVAELVASEFFMQGDIERKLFNTEPQFMMDREHYEKLPEMQIDFIDSICIPLYTPVAKIFPKLSPLVEGCLSNRNCWKAMSEGKEIDDIWIQDNKTGYGKSKSTNKSSEYIKDEIRMNQLNQLNPILKETTEMSEELNLATTVGITEDRDVEEFNDQFLK